MLNTETYGIQQQTTISVTRGSYKLETETLHLDASFMNAYIYPALCKQFKLLVVE